MDIKLTDNHDYNAYKVILDKKFNVPEIKKENTAFVISAIYNDHMVLQANVTCRIFGQYSGDSKYVAAVLRHEEGGEVRTFYSENINGEFEIWMSPTGYGGPYTLTIIDEAGCCVVFSDVLFGEVFVMGGQSNMGWSMSQCYDGTASKLYYQDIIDNSANDNVRYMQVYPNESDVPVEYLSSCITWIAASSKCVVNQCAVPYFFARRLNELYNVPVGVVVACMGATHISTWTIGGRWYNGVVKPVTRMTVRGVCWYQGEGDPENYGQRLAELISMWRSEFENPSLYWAAVQLPRYINWEGYARSREEVKKVADIVDKYTYCVTLDTGLYPEWVAEGDPFNDDGVHPYQKEEIGSRLAEIVAGDFFGAPGVWSSPYMERVCKTENGTVDVTYKNVGEGLVLAGSYGFEVADGDGTYYDATPHLVGKDKIVLSCRATEDIKKVRYGYKNKRGEQVHSCAESVCVYNSKDGRHPAYPGEQFETECE